MLIYQIIHLESGCRYIGQTTRSPKERWKEHLYTLRKNKHGNRYLQAAWNKYGEKAFKFQIIKEFNTIEELNKAEIELIREGNKLYNLAEGGNAFQHNDKIKRKIGEVNKIPIVGMNIKTQEIKEYDSAADAKIDGFDEKSIRKCVAEYLAKKKDGTTSRSISHKNWVWMSKEKATIEKLKEKADIAKRSRVRLERPIVGMNVFDKSFIHFRSCSEAGRSGFIHGCVSKAIKNMAVHKGYVWSYTDVDNPQSLLEKKKKYVLSKVRTGPKSWCKE